MKNFVFTFLVIFVFSNLGISQTKYHFDSTAEVIGCARAAFQKISSDHRYEIRVEISIDSLPKFKDLDIIKYSKFIKIVFRKYPEGNNYIFEFCNDELPANKFPKVPDVYYAIKGRIKITKWNEKPFYVSLVLKKFVFENTSKQKIKLPLEEFKNILIGWVAG